MRTENPYQATDVEDTRTWWSGMPAWLRRFAKVCAWIAVVLIAINVPIQIYYWSCRSSADDVGQITESIKERVFGNTTNARN